MTFIDGGSKVGVCGFQATQAAKCGKSFHSIINKPPKPAWLKDLAVIDMGLYRRFYRQKRRSFAGAGDGAIREGATFSTPSSIKLKDSRKACRLGQDQP
jgi:hypothetical protein